MHQFIQISLVENELIILNSLLGKMNKDQLELC